MEYIDLLSMILPDGILDYFKVTKATKSNDYFVVRLEEKAAQGNKIDGIPVTSDGFHKEISQRPSIKVKSGSFTYPTQALA